MAALTPVQHVAVHLFVVWIQFAQAPEDPVSAKPGQNVTLQCNTYTDAAIKLLKWSRPELKRYVFFHSDNKSMETYQDPRYRGRIELKDPLMKNGDASVLLKNVDISDTGKYLCLVITDSSNQSVREFVRSVHLSVSEQVKAKAGEDVTLQCNTSTDAAVTKLEWRRTGLKDDYVLYFRDNRANESFQDPRYRGRVQLKDPEMKNGDASVLLKNVSIKDTGKYQCLVLTSPQNSSKRDAGEPLVASIQLSVYTFEVKAGPGEDVTLQCNGPKHAAVTLLHWKRSELKHYVFYSRVNKSMESYQNPRYHGRVKLKNPEMKNGDFTLLLKNVSVNDTGTFECLVTSNDVVELVASVHLIVSDGELVFLLKSSSIGSKMMLMLCDR